MEDPEIHLLDMARSNALETRIRERAARLSTFSRDIQKCQVWVESPHGHHQNGRVHAVRIRLTVPGEEIIIDLQPKEEDVSVAVRQSFDAARRRLEDYERRRRGRIKSHPRARGDRARRRQVPPRSERS